MKSPRVNHLEGPGSGRRLRAIQKKFKQVANSQRRYSWARTILAATLLFALTFWAALAWLP